MNSLPDELHLTIASHLDDRKDSANYRLTSTRFARIGAEPFFRTLDFGRCALDQSLERIRAVASSPFAKYVNGLNYDAGNGPGNHHQSRCSAVNVQPRAPPPKEHLCEIAQVYREEGLCLNSVQLHKISFYYFLSAGYAKQLAHTCASVKNLGLFFRPLSDGADHGGMQVAEYNIRNYLTSLHKLEVLSFTVPITGHSEDQHRLCDLIPSTHKWPNLRELNLYGIVCAAPDLVMLLHNHAHSLEYIWLQALELGNPEVLGGPAEARRLTEDEKGEGWRKVFAQIREMNLKHAYVAEARWPSAQYKKTDSLVTRWILDGNDGKEVFVHTNLFDYLDDEWEDDSDYNGEDDSEDDSDYDGKDDSEDDSAEYSDEYSDDSEFWSDESDC